MSDALLRFLHGDPSPASAVLEGRESADVEIQGIIDCLTPSSLTCDEESCYEGTDVLCNYFGIADEEVVLSLERRFSLIRGAEMIGERAEPPFEFATIEDINGRLFGDLYPSAGTVRSGDLFPYCRASYLIAEGERIVKGLQKTKYLKNADRAESARFLTSFIADFTALHPFPRGNFETMLLFLERVGSHSGFFFSWGDVDRDVFSSLCDLSLWGNLQPLADSMASIVQRESRERNTPSSVLKDNPFSLRLE